MDILSTREWATVIWGFIIFVFMISQKSIRESFRQVIKSMFAKRLCILWLISIGYVLGITLIFYNMPFWKNIYIKDIVVWFIF